MPYRKNPIIANEIYHVFNRSIARQPIFLSKRDYLRITELIQFYRFSKPPLRYSYFNRLSVEQKKNYIENNMSDKKPMLKIISYCIMPNHFHFLLQGYTNNAISDFMRNIQNGYSKYFNLKQDRSGSLFQSMFKAVLIETNEQLLHVSRYIHLNPVSSSLIRIDDLESYPWSSFPHYMNDSHLNKFIENDIVLNQFSSIDTYKSFVFDQVDYQKNLETIKHLTFE